MIRYQVARLGLWIDTTQSGLNIPIPPGIEKFLQPVVKPQALFHIPSEIDTQETLVFQLRNKPLPEAKSSDICKFRTASWEFWVGAQGDYIFKIPNQESPRAVMVNNSFSIGEVYGNFSEQPVIQYPLQDMDIRICAAWLGSHGDVLLHASGAIIDGRGYAFLGDSGAGKSTLAAALASDPSVTILGEDQVVLRYLDNQFWIYGTPWHLNPELCSPQGAPLEKLFFLGRKGHSRITQIAPIEGVSRILQTAFIPFYLPELIPGILDRLSHLSETLSFYELSYQMGSNIRELIIN